MLPSLLCIHIKIFCLQKLTASDRNLDGAWEQGYAGICVRVCIYAMFVHVKGINMRDIFTCMSVCVTIFGLDWHTRLLQSSIFLWGILLL